MAEFTAAEIRAAGVDQAGAKDDRDLEDAVAFMIGMGFTLDDLVGRNFGDVVTNQLLRPGATIDPAPLIGDDEEFANRLRVAMGFPSAQSLDEDDRIMLTQSEVDAATFFTTLAELFGDDEALSLLRVLSSSASRVARAATSMLRLQLEDDGPLAPTLAEFTQLIRMALPDFESAYSTMLRSHFALLVLRDEAWTVDQSRSATLEEKVVGFADLVGFTAFTERANAEQFMRAMVGFEEDVQAAVVDHGGTLVKLIGDEVMFVAPDADSALQIAQALSDVGRRSGDLDGMRVGLSGGQVINSGGDYFGTVVNIAARIVNLAFTHAIVVTAPVAAALQFSVPSESLGFHTLRGISAPVELFRLRP